MEDIQVLGDKVLSDLGEPAVAGDFAIPKSVYEADYKVIGAAYLDGCAVLGEAFEVFGAAGKPPAGKPAPKVNTAKMPYGKPAKLSGPRSVAAVHPRVVASAVEIARRAARSGTAAIRGVQARRPAAPGAKVPAVASRSASSKLAARKLVMGAAQAKPTSRVLTSKQKTAVSKLETAAKKNNEAKKKAAAKGAAAHAKVKKVVESVKKQVALAQAAKARPGVKTTRVHGLAGDVLDFDEAGFDAVGYGGFTEIIGHPGFTEIVSGDIDEIFGAEVAHLQSGVEITIDDNVELPEFDDEVMGDGEPPPYDPRFDDPNYAGDYSPPPGSDPYGTGAGADPYGGADPFAGLTFPTDTSSAAAGFITGRSPEADYQVIHTMPANAIKYDGSRGTPPGYLGSYGYFYATTREANGDEYGFVFGGDKNNSNWPGENPNNWIEVHGQRYHRDWWNDVPPGDYARINQMSCSKSSPAGFSYGPIIGNPSRPDFAGLKVDDAGNVFWLAEDAPAWATAELNAAAALTKKAADEAAAAAAEADAAAQAQQRAAEEEAMRQADAAAALAESEAASQAAIAQTQQATQDAALASQQAQLDMQAQQLQMQERQAQLDYFRANPGTAPYPSEPYPYGADQGGYYPPEEGGDWSAPSGEEGGGVDDGSADFTEAMEASAAMTEEAALADESMSEDAGE